MKNLTLTAVALCVALAAASCKTKPKDEYAGVDGDFVSGVPLPDRQDGAAYLGGNVAKGQFQPVQFGFDSFEVSGSETGKVQAVADFMRSAKGDVIIAGFTDERGTEEYNRGLGERRALAVREKLIGLGVGGGRIQTVSFGEEMPVDSGGGDSAWAANRRAEFGVIR
ncbi:MAG: OmpA family protein [Chthoniobacterales bacterium]|nr:OmpA family protein [Chthoniobacterales bacterium]